MSPSKRKKSGLRRYIARARRREELRKERYSPQKYAAYVRWKRKRNIRYGLIAAVILLALILIIAGISKISGSGKDGKGKDVENTVPETEIETTTEQTPQEKVITIGTTGSVFLHDSNLISAKQDDGSYDFSESFQYVTSYYSGVDYMSMIFEGSHQGTEKNDYMGYPLFNSPDIIAKNMKDSGVDIVQLANNHIYDGLYDGFHRTLSVYDDYGITYGGVKNSLDQKSYTVVDINGIKVGFIGYLFRDEMYDENRIIVNENYIRVEDEPLINIFDYNDLDTFYEEMKGHIANMKADGAQFIIANMHWGGEYSMTSDSRQEGIAQTLADMGVDAIFGGHPHVIEPIDVIEASDGRQVFIIYSQGNLLCNQRKELMETVTDGHTEDGVMVTLTLKQDENGKVSCSDADILPTWCCKFYVSDDEYHYYILPLDDIDNLESMTGLTGIKDEAQASYDRTMELLGPGLEKAKSIFN